MKHIFTRVRLIGQIFPFHYVKDVTLLFPCLHYFLTTNLYFYFCFSRHCVLFISSWPVLSTLIMVCFGTFFFIGFVLGTHWFWSYGLIVFIFQHFWGGVLPFFSSGDSYYLIIKLIEGVPWVTDPLWYWVFFILCHFQGFLLLCLQVY